MSIQHKLAEFLAYSNLIIAFSSLTLAAGSAKVIGVSDFWEYGIFSFFATLVVYNAQRLISSNKLNENPRLIWMSSNHLYVYSSTIISSIISLYYFFKLMNGINIKAILFMGLAAFISLFYVVRIGKRNLREISFVKTHSIALCWTTVLLIFPLINSNNYRPELIIFFLSHYLYFLGLAAIFDINDLDVDPALQRTIPQIIGYQRTKKTATILLMISGFGISYYTFSPLIILAITTQILLIRYVSDKRPHYYFNIYIDGAISLLGISYLIT
ncbi:MAG: hypothetical protein ACPGSO_08425 [Vicingaceae bacterium]